MTERTSNGCCCFLPSYIGVGIQGIFLLSVLIWGVSHMFRGGTENLGFVLISSLFLAPFVWVCCDQDSVKARLVLYIFSVITWIALIVFVTLFMMEIIGLSSAHASPDSSLN